MRFITFLLPLLLATGQVDARNQKNFRIYVHEWTFWQDNDFFFSKDSLNVTLAGMRLMDSTSVYARKLTVSESEQISQMLETLDFSNDTSELEVRDFPDHGGTYTFKLTFDGKTYQKDIWAEKVICYVQLVKVLNQLLPAKFRLGYTDEYFKKGTYRRNKEKR